MVKLRYKISTKKGKSNMDPLNQNPIAQTNPISNPAQPVASNPISNPNPIDQAPMYQTSQSNPAPISNQPQSQNLTPPQYQTPPPPQPQYQAQIPQPQAYQTPPMAPPPAPEYLAPTQPLPQDNYQTPFQPQYQPNPAQSPVSNDAYTQINTPQPTYQQPIAQQIQPQYQAPQSNPAQPQQQLPQLSDDLLIQLGFGAMPAPARDALLAQLKQTLEMRVGMEIYKHMREDQLKEFEGLMPANDEQGNTILSVDAAQANSIVWLNNNMAGWQTSPAYAPYANQAGAVLNFAALNWLQKNFPSYKDVVGRELTNLINEVKRDKDAIISTITPPQQG